ncbi:MAG: MOSC domain-containing protein [Planctomycetota bacterium]
MPSAIQCGPGACPLAEVVAIQICAKAADPLVERDEVVAVAGKGLEGDRYFRKVGTYAKAGKLGAGKEITLVEEESLAAAKLEHGVEVSFRETRRNVLVRGVGLNDLVGREFLVGDVLLLGVKLCEPCIKIASWSKKPLIRALCHRGGLNARILRGGTIRKGHAVAVPSLHDEGRAQSAP